MRCPHCGFEETGKAGYCSGCGRELANLQPPGYFPAPTGNPINTEKAPQAKHAPKHSAKHSVAHSAEQTARHPAKHSARHTSQQSSLQSPLEAPQGASQRASQGVSQDVRAAAQLAPQEVSQLASQRTTRQTPQQAPLQPSPPKRNSTPVISPANHQPPPPGMKQASPVRTKKKSSFIASLKSIYQKNKIVSLIIAGVCALFLLSLLVTCAYSLANSSAGSPGEATTSSDRQISDPETPKELALEGLANGSGAATPTGTLRVHFIDVGQGDSEFLELPNGEVMLIDAGTASNSSAVAAYINNLGYSRLDYVVATHPHEDHIGGLISIIGSFEIGELWAPRVTHTTQTYEDFLDAVDEKGLSIRTAEAGKQIVSGEGCTIEIVSPPAGAAFSDLNDWSAVLSVVFNQTSFLFVGDSSAEVILAGYQEHVDVLKVGHHGSSTSTTEHLVSQLTPHHAVISCGIENTYGHPTDQALAALASATVYRTDLQGTVVATSDGTDVSFSVDPAPFITSESESIPNPETEVAPAISAPEPAPDDPTVFITNTGSKYHNDGCRYLSQSRIETTLSSAKARGLTPCSVCNPPG